MPTCPADHEKAALTPCWCRLMLASMVPDGWVYRRASRLIEQHGDDAMMIATHLVAMAFQRREKDVAAVMLRVRRAVAELQARPKGPLH